MVQWEAHYADECRWVLFTCGSSSHGQLGHGDQQDQNLPKKIDHFMKKRIEMIAAGGKHSLVVADGELWSFGNGVSGRLGHNDRESQSLPKKVECMNGKRIEMISPGGDHSLLLANGDLWSFGNGRFGQLGHNNLEAQLVPKKVEAFAGKYVQGITAGLSHSFALVDGELYSFGNGECGRLGPEENHRL